MAPRGGKGISGYLEVFLLIGVALGGSAIVAQAAFTYSASTGGPSLTLSGATISQGAAAAVEELTVYNSGTTRLGPLSVDTAGVPSTAKFCLTVSDPENQTVLYSGCPSLTGDPAAVAVPLTLAPGTSAAIELALPGVQFEPGSVCSVTVTATGGAEQTVDVDVVPA